MKERGAAYAEFAITLPVLLLLVFSILAVSRLLNNLSFLIPTSYESYLAGSMAADGSSQSQMAAVCNLFRDRLENDVENQLCASSNFENGTLAWTDSTNTDRSAETVSIRLPSQLGYIPLSGMGALSLNLGLTGIRVTRSMTLANAGLFDVLLPGGTDEFWACDGTDQVGEVTSECGV
jgi:Flp pilus assembly protein TadG